MGLKKLLDTLKSEGYIIKKLDQFLLAKNDEDEGDRRSDINSPSSASRCERAIVYGRLGYETDGNSIDARTRRIFDNGHGMHDRLQKYMREQGILVMDEVPVYLDRLQIQGHTDGLLQLTKFELGVLEIKSINTNGFSKLIDARADHKEQGLVYLVCMEERRLWLKENFESIEELQKYLVSKEYQEFVENHYQHMKSGNHYSRGDKLIFKYEQHMQADELLWKTPRPINKMVFLYEDKNTQELKEYVVLYNEEAWESLEEKFEYINRYIAKNKVPPKPKEATSKSCTMCRWCSFKNNCYPGF